ncbi:fumarate reductase/succinate dehydrogenase flavoprotein domain protein [Alkalidesulfovibrio alkalitolerans DSM 16529]|uniref:Fumarate reductase/succinate dehydrogenase flavoprotein domain protein n=2 Tax=Alkalidesulfovibrio alkalitolerans TaxID=293256 RepID=S7UUV8_9BACT|nr:fumarate reductase/succinate dehydrogenase flavoprotein domain protein [Alkalidesulfovibrio alkalitolerans DSM 16529]
MRPTRRTSRGSGMDHTRTHITRHETDVLVLGAGLAGLRAAWAALAENPGARVTVISAGSGPSGSSFANLHDRLGMQTCPTDEDAADLVAEALAVGRPGHVEPVLAQALATDARERFEDMKDLGLPFIARQNGSPELFSACFSPASRRAVVFEDLGRVFTAFKTRGEELGGHFLSGLTVRGLVVRDGRALGALAEDARGRASLFMAKAVIMALGGPAPLFAHNQAGPGNPGFSLGLLGRAGARLVNQGYLQYMWASLPDRAFWNLAAKARQGLVVRSPDGGLVPLPDDLAELAAERKTHCPFGHGLPDAELDRFLLRHLDAEGAVMVRAAAEDFTRVAPMAHAGNGGALIDEHGQTSVAGLYACGECASGMHGANRIGGAMVLATQVFGTRAGRHAAGTLKKNPESSDISFSELMNDSLAPRSQGGRGTEPDRDREHLHALAWSLQMNMAMQKSPTLEAARAELSRRREQTAGWRARLALETGMELLTHIASHN